MNQTITRRDMLGRSIATGAAALSAGTAFGACGECSTDAKKKAFPISLNSSTIRGHKLPLTKVIDIAAKAGYQGIEPWADEIDRHLQSGGTLKDVATQLKDRGLTVTGAIAFFRWMVDDETERAKAFDEAKRRIAQLAEIRATHIAAPPAGNVKNVNLLDAAGRYRQLLELAEPFGVVPAIEVWGPAANLNRLGQAALVAIEADHPKACILPDVYHLYKGGSALTGVRLLNPRILAGFHLNDYPADPPREKIRDANRVYPGDGIAPLKELFCDLREIGYTGPLSIELFNPNYYKQDPMLVAKTALEKTKRVMQAALG